MEARTPTLPQGRQGFPRDAPLPLPVPPIRPRFAAEARENAMITVYRTAAAGRQAAYPALPGGGAKTGKPRLKGPGRDIRSRPAMAVPALVPFLILRWKKWL